MSDRVGVLRRFVKRVSSSLRFRRRAISLGVHSLLPRAVPLKTARIAGRRVQFSLPQGEEAVLTHEFAKLFLDDCYGLERIAGGIETVLDVGANVGLFSLAARHRYRSARIHAYEPNPALTGHLMANTVGLDIRCHLEAVGTDTGRAYLHARGDSLHSVVDGREDSGGLEVAKIPMSAAISRLGGTVDLLKLDCEGGEWDLLDDPSSWNGVRHLSMEYHLWARPGSSVENVTGPLESMGFRVLRLLPAPSGTFGLLSATRQRAR